MNKIIFFFVIFTFGFSSCTSEKVKRTNESIELHIIAYSIDNNSGLVYYIENVSEYNVFLLDGKSEILPKVFAQFATDSIWYNVSESFYFIESGLPAKSQANKNVSCKKFNIEPKD